MNERHPSVASMRTVIALDQAAERVGLISSAGVYGRNKWDVSLSSPEGRELTRLSGLTRTNVVAMIAALNAVGDLKDALDSAPLTPLHGQARGVES